MNNVQAILHDLMGGGFGPTPMDPRGMVKGPALDVTQEELSHIKDYLATRRAAEAKSADPLPPSFITRAVLNNVYEEAAFAATLIALRGRDQKWAPGRLSSLGEHICKKVADAINAHHDARGHALGTPMSWADCRAEYIAGLKTIIAIVEAKDCPLAADPVDANAAGL